MVLLPVLFTLILLLNHLISAVVVQLLSCVQLCDPHGLQHIRLPCPSPSPRDCSNSYPLNQWCYPNISSSVTPFSSCPQSFPTSGSFPIRWPKYWSFGFSISPSSSRLISFTIEWFDLAVYGTLKSLLQLHSSKSSVRWLRGILLPAVAYKDQRCIYLFP